MLEENGAVAGIMDGQRFIETSHHIAVFQHHANVMGGQNDGQGHALASRELIHRTGAGGRIDAGRGFIENQKLRPAARARAKDSLFLPAGEFIDGPLPGQHGSRHCSTVALSV